MTQSKPTPLNIVWLKRDLRAVDHEPLAAATRLGATAPLVIIEPGLWAQRDMSGRHYGFWCECLAALQDTGLPVSIRVGDVIDVLSDIHTHSRIGSLWSHEETGNAWTYQRDKAVAAWCKANSIEWTQIPQFGVFRGRVNRDRWAAGWEKAMATPPADDPIKDNCVALPSDALPHTSTITQGSDACPQRQKGGRPEGLKLLESFLEGGRARSYQRAMSNPLEGADACSRLSTHFAYGSLSMREVVQRAYAHEASLKTMMPIERPLPPAALRAFIARLHWHCHFIQKFETEPEIETRDLHPAFREARNDGIGTPRYEAWAAGNTGFPFVDACMRSLIATGWINFRMRAMLTAFASYQLWLDWRATGTRLAQLFTDYEPGIHWSQIQMQSGSTAINTPRMYNPVKQSYDQDPEGIFIKRWVPELAHLEGQALHEPWTEANADTHGYPARIVDHLIAARQARVKLKEIRSTSGFYQHQHLIYEKHGSRKTSRHTPKQGRPWAKKKAKPTAQLELEL